MLNKYVDSMPSYLQHLPHGNYQVETRPIVREARFTKFVNIPILRFFLAAYFIYKDDAYLRPHKPDSSRPMFYRLGFWKVHNCGRRKDGTFLTSGGAVMWIFKDSEVVYDSTVDNIPFAELKERFGSHL